MHRATKFLALSVLVPALAGCKPTGKVNSPEDYLPYVSMGLEAAATASAVGQTEAISKRAFAACVTLGVLESAFRTASDAVVGAATKNAQIPAVDVDVSVCLEFKPGSTDGKDISGETQALIDVWSSTALSQAKFFIDKLEKSNCKGHQGGLAALSYVEQVQGPIVEEISSPDGKLSLPAVAVDLSACEE